jgi:GMP synthase (glutamine-hydrolysing)
LIVETGQPVPSMRRYGGFPHWIRVAAGLSERDAVVVDVEHGADLPNADDFAGVIVTGSGAMVTDRADWSERSAQWLREAAHAGMPVLGICYGHQLLAHALGGEVGYHPAGREMGTVELDLHPSAAEDPLFAGLPGDPWFYYVHSLHGVPDDPTTVAATCDYGGPLNAAFRRDNVFAVQFHPEKSASAGLALLGNFVAAVATSAHRAGVR